MIVSLTLDKASIDSIVKNGVAYGTCLVFALTVGGYMCSGAMHSPLYTLFGIGKPRTRVSGFVKPGYECVKAEFEKILNDGMEDKAQACAFVGGEVVVDLVGVVDMDKAQHPSEDHIYSHQSIQNVFSSTKALTSIVVAMLVDKGHLKYDMRVCDVWPEFSQQGKHVITVEDLLKHEAGLQKFGFSIPAKDLHRKALKQNSVSSLIAESSSTRSDQASADAQRMYHYLTRDIIVNEVVMRADPQGRTVGEIIRDDIAGPLGLRDQLTLGEETVIHKKNVFPLVKNRPLWVLMQMCNFITGKLKALHCVIHLFLLNAPMVYGIAQFLYGPNYAKPSIVLGDGHPDHMFIGDLFNHDHIREAEVPSANGHASAFALAKTASVMSAGGSAHGVQLLSPTTYRDATGNITDKYDKSLLSSTRFTRGGWAVFDTSFAHYRHGSIGWFGIGGSAMMWHRDLDIGFGYAGTLLSADVGNKHSALIQNAVISAAMKLKSSTDRNAV